MEAVYSALAAEAVGGDKNSPPPSLFGDSREQNSSQYRAHDEEEGRKPAGLLHATISRYFDEGPGGGSKGASGEVCEGSGSGGYGGDNGDIGGDDSATARDDEEEKEGEEEEKGALSSNTGTNLLPPLPHQPLDERACEVLVRDASVLVSDPSFGGRMDAAFEDDYSGVGGGLGFLDVTTGLTAAAGSGGGGSGGGGRTGGGMAPHAWLLKVGVVLFFTNIYSGV